ncbi:MAG: hypothetical protein VW265_05435, partial [Hyphomicrobiales bacterium]
MKKSFLNRLGIKPNIKLVNETSLNEFDDKNIVEAIVFASRDPIHIDYLITKISKNDKSYLNN